MFFIESIISSRIECFSDIEKALQSSQDVQNTAAELWDSKYKESETTAKNYLAINSIFKVVAGGSMGSSIQKDIERLQTLSYGLQNQIVCISRQILRPLYLSAFKCHQSAIENLRNNQADKALEEMDPLGEIERMCIAGLSLSAQISSDLSDQTIKALKCARLFEKFECFSQNQQVIELELDSDLEFEYILQKEKPSFQGTIKELTNLNTLFMNYWAGWFSLQSQTNTFNLSRTARDFLEISEPEEAEMVIHYSLLNWLLLAKAIENLTASIEKTSR